LMADTNRVLTTMTQISALGVDISLDDYGTGYSSLQHLRKLPLREVKIDRSFVGGMAHNADDAAIVRSTVELARALGLRAVAEGVEDERTWRQLAEVGCELAQGWYTARPMPADAIPGWLRQRARSPLSSGVVV
jgi:diguanylate cyclase